MMNTEFIDSKISKSIVSFFVLQSINAVVKTADLLSGPIVGYISAITGILIMVGFAKSYSYVRARSGNLLTRTYAIFILAYAFSIMQAIYVRHEPIGLLLKESALWTLAFWVPIGVYTYSIRNLSVLYKVFYKYSFVISGLMMFTFFWFIMVGAKTGDEKDYNMFFSYTLLVPLLFHINEYIDKRKGTIELLALLEIAAIVMYGSRGAFLSIAVFVFFKMFASNKGTGNKKTLFAILVGAGLIFMFLYQNQGLLESFGLHSRLFEKMSAGESTKGRDYVWQAGLYLVGQRPLLGYGLGGEFYEMTRMCEKILGVYVEEVSSLTPHNGVIQLMLNFGIPIGVLLSLWIIISIRKLKCFTNNQVRALFLILFACYIVPSMTVGDGIFIKPGIAIYIFIALNAKNLYNYELSKYQTEITR